MDILYCGDRAIEDGVLISLLSIARTNSLPLDVHILTAGFSVGARHYEPVAEGFARRLEALLRAERGGVSVELVDASAAFGSEPPTANLKSRFTPCCMLRLYADLTHLEGRVLYLDNDVVCRRPLDELWSWDLAGGELGGVLDNYGRWFFYRRPPRQDYLNSGVLLMDLDRMRQTGLLARCRKRCATRPMMMPDQSALNKLAAGKAFLPRRFNEQQRLRPDTVLQHFTTQIKLLPYPHLQKVKPWQPELVHGVLGLHEYDGLLDDWLALRDRVVGRPL